jgi:hypothetical protein
VRSPLSSIDFEVSERSEPLISTSLPVSTRAPARARQTLGDLAETLPAEVLRDAQLLVSELVTHRVRRLPEGRGTLKLEVSMSGSRVRVEVVDFEPGPARADIGSNEPALGWELQVVAQIADGWGIRRNGRSTIWFELER